MACYHVKGNTLHSGLHIILNKAQPIPLGNSEKNTLHAKYFETKVVFYDEMSMVGRELFGKVNIGWGKYLAHERLFETCM